jgi:nucleoside 2-deoxyribosyltransferase
MQNNEKKILVIGEVYTDVHLDNNPIIYRLGGIFHSARALNSIKNQYALGVLTPEYLEGSITKFGIELGASSCVIVGEIKNVPNVMLIMESTEAGNQGYNDILKDQSESVINAQAISDLLQEFKPTDILIYPGKYNLLEIGEILINYSGRIHVDFQYENQYLDPFAEQVKIDTLILSTSSSIFTDICAGDSNNLVSLLQNKTESILLKENRGGSRYFSYEDATWLTAPAYLNETAHSVGVGDCFNSFFLSSIENPYTSMKLASYAASFYASTFDHKIYLSNVENIFELKNQIVDLQGVRLGWEERAEHHIYIAAPDFPYLDTKWIQTIYNSLKYHNFIPHRPVLENGIIIGDEEDRFQLETYYKDIKLLEQCSVLVAVLLNDDPGTYVEIGWMARSNKPTILFDPYYKANNLFLKKTVSRICHSLSEVINAVFEFIGSEGEEVN